MKLNNILNFFGKDNQMVKLHEEYVEFGVAFVEYSKNPCEDTYKALLSELVDISVLTEQIGYTEGIHQHKFDRMFYDEKKYKIDRTVELINRAVKEGKTYEEVRRC